MRLSNLLKYFTSSFYSSYPYILRYEDSLTNLEKQKFVVVKNLNYNSSVKNTTEGIRFEIVTGSLYNSSVVTQPFTIKVINKNSLNLYNTLFLNFYEVDESSQTLSLKAQVTISSVTTPEQFISRTITGRNIFIALESVDRVLYTSQDLEKGLIPIRQDLFVKLISEGAETYLPVFYSDEDDKVFALKNYRTTLQRYVFSLSVRTFENANLCDTIASNVIGDLSIGTIKDFLFSFGYYVTDRQKNYVKGATLSLLEFLSDFYNFSKLDIFELGDLSVFPKYGDFYYSSYYYDATSSNPQPHEYSIDIRNEIIAMFVTSFLLDSLSTQAVNKFIRKTDFLLNNFGLLPEKYMTSNGLQFGGQKLFTNLLYLQILRNIGSSNYSSVRNSIKTAFLDHNTLEINTPPADPNYVYTTESGAEAYITKILLSKHFNPSDYEGLLPTLDETIAFKSTLIGSINRNTDPSSSSYNPYFQVNLDSARVFYLHGDYVHFGLNALLFKLLGINFPSDLYTDKGLIQSNKYEPSKMLFILPELFSSLLYLATKHFYFSNIQFSQPRDEIQIASIEAKVYGSLLEARIMLSIPKKVYGFLLDKNTNYVHKMEFSPTRALNHTIVFSVQGINISNTKLAFILA
jgi:hypothetical protein